MIKQIIAVIAGIASIIAFFAAIINYLDTPEVYVGDITGKCMKVINSDGSLGNCNTLPKAYTTHVVKEK